MADYGADFGSIFGDLFGGVNPFDTNPAKRLDDLWRDAILHGNFNKYDWEKNKIKNSGKKVFRNSQGKHKVV